MYPAVYLLRDPRKKSRPIFYVGAVPQSMQSGPGRARPVDLATGNLIPVVEWDARGRVEVILESGLTPICEVIYYRVPPRNVGLAVDALIATMTTKPLNRSCHAVLDVDGAVARMEHPAPVSLPEDSWAFVHVLPATVAAQDVLASPDVLLRAVRDFKVGSEPVGPAISRAVDAVRAEGDTVLLLAVTSGERGLFAPGIVAGVWQVVAMEDRGNTVRVHAAGGAGEEVLRTRLRWGQLHVDGVPWMPKTAMTRGLWLPHTPR